ncbi:3-oxoacyl-reductase [Plectosphaerella plurivora]|uniref:3-oxoacyl-reductase n=1 Tax=Plectosphaerella plurivora TaxID=936078 RepID=A0A9P8V8Z4_9PEZI|nr:3-oxoacyl-reductase [Plectosphaerella plurivora]
MLPLLCCPTPTFLRRSSSKQNGAKTTATQSSSQSQHSTAQNLDSHSEEGLVLADRRPKPVSAATAPAATSISIPESGRHRTRPGLTPTVTRKSSILWTKPLPQLPPPHMALSGKIALVTGGARGIGAAIALKLAQDGARVALTFHHATSVSRAHAVITSIEDAGSSATAIQADVTHDPERVIKHALKAFGVDKIDILVNNAGVALDTSLAETTPAAYDRVFECNSRAVFFMIRAAAPHLAPGGRIINISASAARGSDPGSMAFAGSKAAVEAFTRVAAQELGADGRGITVNCVSPGMIRTEDFETITEDAREETAKGTPAGERIGSVEDVADVVAFLAGDGARWMTGAVVPVNGGKTMF